MSQNEQMGIDMARSNVGAWEGDFESARDALRSSGRSITDEGALEGYMNPYMEEVLAPQRRRQNEAFEAERASRRAGQGARGAFGGRADLYDNQFESEFQRRQTELTGSAYGAAFDRATGLFGEERQRDIQRGGAFQALGEGAQGQRRADLRDLMQTGLTERTRDQADLDFQYLEHLEERDWDVSNLNTLVQTLAAVPSDITESGESTQTQTTRPSAMQTIAGIGAITAGAIMTGGASLAAGGGFWEGVGGALIDAGRGGEG
jgi:hypothetical protein